MKQKVFRQLQLALAGVCAALFVGCGTADAPAQDSSQAWREEPAGEEARPGAETNQKKAAQGKESQDEQPGPREVLSDGVYTAVFDTDSSMFHLNESCEGRARLTVVNGEMTIHIPLVSKSIVNLFPGTAREACAADESEWLQPVAESVTYSDGYTEEVYAFDVPVPAIDTSFELALIGTKGKWYDHVVSVTDPQLEKGEDLPAEDGETKVSGAGKPQAALENGVYRVEVTLLGGTGRSDIASPAELMVSDEGMVATITWSSPYYDYMVVDGVTYEPVNTTGNSVFEIPVAALDTEIAVTADTVAMSVPHEIAYTLIFDSAGAKPAEQENAQK